MNLDISQFGFELNNREIATLLYILGALSAAFCWKATRDSFLDFMIAFFGRKPIILWLSMSLYLLVCISILTYLNLWQPANLKATFVWWLTVGFTTVFDANRLSKGSITVRELARDTFALSAVIPFITELVSFPLWIELLLIPLFVALALLIAAGQPRTAKPDMRRAVKLLSMIQASAGSVILIVSVTLIFRSLEQFWSFNTLREFALPLLLWLMFLPFMLSLAALFSYENEFTRLALRPDQSAITRYAKWQAFLAFGWSVELVRRLTRDMRNRGIADREGVKSAITEIKRLKKLERQPPSVLPSEGWSPYKADSCLQQYGIVTGDYHRTSHGWTAESSRISLSDNVLADEITYRIYGNDRAVTQLQFELRGHNRNNNAEAGAAFDERALAILNQVVQDGDVSEIYRTAEFVPSQAVKSGAIAIEIKHHRWGDGESGGYSKRLIVTHEMHKTVW
ncbi:MAG: hypothetical protein KL839_01975 [Rhizobium sp.]|nr:hypothetical protein [Rhizobium sp.]